MPLVRKVLEYSIKSRTTSKVTFTPISEIGSLGSEYDSSFNRWLIPSALKWRGQFIYLDDYQVFLDDIRKLWASFHEAEVLPGTSTWVPYIPGPTGNLFPCSHTMLVKCKEAREQWGWQPEQLLSWLQEPRPRKELEAFHHLSWLEPKAAYVSSDWLCSIKFNDYTRAVFYPTDTIQPWRFPGRPGFRYWLSILQQAIKNGYIKKSEVHENLERFGKPEGWKKTQVYGLNPDFKKLLTGI